MSVSVLGDDWTCSCGAAGINGEAALLRHSNVMHGPMQLYPLRPLDGEEPHASAGAVRGPIVPEGVYSRLVRAWARENGWPLLGDRGRMPQEAIDAYVRTHP